jgi:hypothetical protein
MNPAGFRGSRLLTGAGFRHAFFTRAGGVSEGPYASLNFSVSVGDDAARVQTNVTRAAATLGVAPARFYFLSQIHGARVFTLRGDEDRERVVEWEGDAVVSANPECAVSVRVADCVPVLVADKRSGAAAAIHAGWRGVVAGVIEAGVAELRRAIETDGDLVAAIGPHIEVSAFEVSDDVAGALKAASPDPDVVDRSFGERPHVNLRRIARAKLRTLGLADPNIDDVPGCTYREPSDFFSFRRDGKYSGRHVAAIVPRRAR